MRREAVDWLRGALEISERLACRAVGLGRSTCRYRPRPITDDELRATLRDFAAKKPRYGYRRLYVLLRRDEVLDRLKDDGQVPEVITVDN